MYHDPLVRFYEHPLISAEEIQCIVTAHRKVSIRKGDHFLKQGEQSDSYLFLMNGLMRSYVIDQEGQDITTGFFCEYELVIEVLSLFKRVKSGESIQALTDCEALEITYKDFQRLFQSIHGLTEWGRLWMTQELFQSKQRTLDMITVLARDRYLQLMVEKPQVIRDSPLKYIASYLGVTDTSLSRIRREI